MTTKAQMQTLLAYHWEMNTRMIDRASNLEEKAYRENPDYGHGSIHDLLFHILRTDSGWRRALETGQQRSPLEPQDFPDLDALQAGFEQEQDEWQAYWDRLPADQVAADIDLTNWRGDTMSFPRWRVFQHLVLHGMQHHAELARALTTYGQSPGDIDFIFFSG